MNPHEFSESPESNGHMLQAVSLSNLTNITQWSCQSYGSNQLQWLQSFHNTLGGTDLPAAHLDPFSLVVLEAPVSQKAKKQNKGDSDCRSMSSSDPKDSLPNASQLVVEEVGLLGLSSTTVVSHC